MAKKKKQDGDDSELRADQPMERLTQLLLERMDLPTLKTALQAAVQLEFATIPPYLCALWSIKDDTHPVAASIREIAQEEMLHMALACNMLTAIGGRPEINTKAAVPVYPGPLPGGVHPGLIAELSGLTKKALAGFMWIERPLKEFDHDHDPAKPGSMHKRVEEQQEKEPDDTIGAFYEAIKTAFEKIEPDMSPDHQISGPLAKAVVRSVADAKWAIELITEQGEGSGQSPEEAPGDLSHFYRFLEVFEGVRLVWDPVTQQLSHGEPLPFPEVYRMGVVPEDGWKSDIRRITDEALRAKVEFYLEEFGKTYTLLLDQLQGAWCLGGQASLIEAYATMFDLEKYAKPLMEIAVPGRDGVTFGPRFWYDESTGLRAKGDS